MKLDKKGVVDLMLIATLVIVIAVGAFVIYRISSFDDGSTLTDTSQNAQTEANKQTETGEQPADTIPDGWAQYSNDAVGLSFIYPEKWSVNEAGNTETDENGYGKIPTLYITLVEAETDSNESLYFSVRKTENSTRSIEFLLSDTLEETTNVKPIKIDGLDGVQYYWQSEVIPEAYHYPDPYIGTEFQSSYYRYSFNYGYDYGTSPDKYMNEYNQIIDSIEVN